MTRLKGLARKNRKLGLVLIMASYHLNLSTSPLSSPFPPFQTRFVGAAALPCTQNEANNVIDALPVLDFRENCRPAVSIHGLNKSNQLLNDIQIKLRGGEIQQRFLPHASGIPFHDS